MKKFVTYIFFFILFVVAIDQAVGKVCDYMQHNSKLGPIKQFDDLCLRDKHDILVMGSSRAKHHYVPQILKDSLGFDVYNAGYDGNGVILSYGVLQMIIERYKPRCIIYDIEPAFDIMVYKPDNERTRYLSNLKRYYSHSGVADVLKDVSRDTYLKSFSGLYRYNSEITSLCVEYIKGGEIYEDGYQPLLGEMQQFSLKEEENVENVVDSVKIGYLEKLIQCCDCNGIQIILSLSPKYQIAENGLYTIIYSMAEKYKVPIIDYYNVDEFLNDKSLFRDSMHLNSKGAIAFTNKISSEIKQMIN